MHLFKETGRVRLFAKILSQIYDRYGEVGKRNEENIHLKLQSSTNETI